MMLSLLAYEVLGFVVEGPVTVHTLSFAYRELPSTVQGQATDRMLLSALTELASRGMIAWSYEPNWGDEPSVRLEKHDACSMAESWYKAFGTAGPRSDYPKAGEATLDIYATERGNAESNADTSPKEYKCYLPFLHAWYDWENDAFDEE